MFENIILSLCLNELIMKLICIDIVNNLTCIWSLKTFIITRRKGVNISEVFSRRHDVIGPHEFARRQSTDVIKGHRMTPQRSVQVTFQFRSVPAPVQLQLFQEHPACFQCSLTCTTYSFCFEVALEPSSPAWNSSTFSVIYPVSSQRFTRICWEFVRRCSRFLHA